MIPGVVRFAPDASGILIVLVAVPAALVGVLVVGGVLLLPTVCAWRFRERYFPLHSCDAGRLAALNAGLLLLAEASGRYAFTAERVRHGTLEGRRLGFILGKIGKVVLGKCGPTWGSESCVFLVVAASEGAGMERKPLMFFVIYRGDDRWVVGVRRRVLPMVGFLD